MSGTSDRFQFSNKRIPCPSCGSKRSFSSVAGNSESGKCHACGIFIGTTATTSNYNDGIITTRGGRVLNVDKNAHTTSNNNSENTEPSHRDVLRSLLPLVHARKRASCPKRPGLPECPGVPECDAFDELAAKFEYESGLSRMEAETQAAKELGYFSDHPNTSMIKIIEEALSLLRRESAFVALLTELTRPTILSEWRVGLTNDIIGIDTTDVEAGIELAQIYLCHAIEIAKTLRSAADAHLTGTELRIFTAITEEPVTTKDIALKTGLSLRSVQQHLKSMQEKGLIQALTDKGPYVRSETMTHCASRAFCASGEFQGPKLVNAKNTQHTQYAIHEECEICYPIGEPAF